MSSRFTDNALTVWKVEGFRLSRLQLDDFEVLQFEAGKQHQEPGSSQSQSLLISLEAQHYNACRLLLPRAAQPWRGQL